MIRSIMTIKIVSKNIKISNKIIFLNNQKKDVETKIEELINILRDDDSNVSRETIAFIY